MLKKQSGAGLLYLGLCAGTTHAALSGFSDFASVNANNPANGYGNADTTFTLTSGGAAYQEATSGFSSSAQNIQGFVASFTYQATNFGVYPGFGIPYSGADGVALVLQNVGTGAVGAPGSGLGYGGISPSAALELNIFPTTGVGETFQTNGNTGGYNTTGFVDLRSGDAINVLLTYNGTTLTEKLTDPTAHTSYSNSYTVNLSGVLGASTALVGFTGGDGFANSAQVVSNFTFTSTPEPTSVVLWGLVIAGGLVIARGVRKV